MLETASLVYENSEHCKYFIGTVNNTGGFLTYS